MDNTFPNGVAAECLFDRHRLEDSSLTAVLRFNGTFQFGDAHVHDMKDSRFKTGRAERVREV